MVAYCDIFANFFADKITCIHHDLDATVTVSEDLPLASACPGLQDSFQLVQPEDVDRLLWSVRLLACLVYQIFPEGVGQVDREGDQFLLKDD